MDRVKQTFCVLFFTVASYGSGIYAAPVTTTVTTANAPAAADLSQYQNTSTTTQVIAPVATTQAPEATTNVTTTTQVAPSLPPIPAPKSLTVTRTQPVIDPSLLAAEAAPLPSPAEAAPLPTTTSTVVTSVTKNPESPPSMIIVPPNQSLGAESFEDAQETMVNTAPAQGPESNEEKEAFNALSKQILPLSSRQIVKLRQLIDTSQFAASIPATVPPKPVSTTLIMNLAPGATPPAIRLAKGYVSSLVFVDSTGAPWPIASFDVGDPKTSTIQWDGSNIMLIQASTPYGVSDLVIRLVGLMTPLTLELVSGQRVVDYRTDIHVSGIGPNTKVIPTGTSLPDSANQLLLNVLDGIAPDGSKPLSIHGGDCQGWFLANKMYLRTRLTLLSPGWIGRMVSPDGMNAYEVPRSATILVSQYGQPIELKIEGF